MNTNNHLSLRRIARATTAAALTALAISAAIGLAGHGLQPAQASGDRPSTPSDVTAVNHDPAGSILVSWTNTSNQDVCFDIAAFRDAAPVTLYVGPCLGGPGLSDSIMFEHLNAGSTYCFEVRARQWNNGDPQDGLVSDQWSNPACATVPVPAPAPAPSPSPKPFNPASETIQPNSFIPSSPTLPGISAAAEASLPFGSATPVPTPIHPGYPH